MRGKLLVVCPLGVAAVKVERGRGREDPGWGVFVFRLALGGARVVA